MTKKKTVGVPYEKTGVDRVHLPQKFSFPLWEAMRKALQNEGVWVNVWLGDNTHEVNQFMRRGRAFAQSFLEHPKEFPELTMLFEVFGKRMKFRRCPGNPLLIEMSIRVVELPWLVLEIDGGSSSNFSHGTH